MENLKSNFGWTTSEPTPAHDYIVPTVLRLLPDGISLHTLDTGRGNSYLAGKLFSLGHTIVGIDASGNGIEIARKIYLGLYFVVYSVYNVMHSIVADEDVVVSSEVIEHLYFQRMFLTNAHQVIRSGGRIILTTPYQGYLKNLLLSIFDQCNKHYAVDHMGGIKYFSQNMISKMLVETGFSNSVFNNAGRAPRLWKFMVCKAIGND